MMSSLLCSAGLSVKFALIWARYGKCCFLPPPLPPPVRLCKMSRPVAPAFSVVDIVVAVSTRSSSSSSSAQVVSFHFTMPNFLTRSLPALKFSSVRTLLPSTVTILSPTSIRPRKVHAGSICVILAPPPHSAEAIANVNPNRPGDTVSTSSDGNSSSSFFFRLLLFVLVPVSSRLRVVFFEFGFAPLGFAQFLHRQSSEQALPSPKQGQ
mmetsp:Transcript_2451/g.6081  ORF Transcript_2451/g.6081 Transcript_2451/m.6081 type:complete len:209 (-) Transcript_2451:743-1369(-)